jgi:guanine deaminase
MKTAMFLLRSFDVLAVLVVAAVFCLISVRACAADNKTPAVQHIFFMREAIKESEKNLTTGNGGPFGAVIVKDGKIIARGHNEVIKNSDSTCHAEIQTIRKACRVLGSYDLGGCELYTSAQPCPMCLSAIIWANIKTVYYGNSAKDAAAVGFRDDYIYKFISGGSTDKKVLTMKQISREEAIKAFEEYKSKRMKIY